MKSVFGTCDTLVECCSYSFLRPIVGQSEPVNHFDSFVQPDLLSQVISGENLFQACHLLKKRMTEKIITSNDVAIFESTLHGEFQSFLKSGKYHMRASSGLLQTRTKTKSEQSENYA